MSLEDSRRKFLTEARDWQRIAVKETRGVFVADGVPTKRRGVILRSVGKLVLEFEVEGFDFSVLDSLQEVLNEMDEVEYAGTSVVHPLFPRLRFVLRVKEGQDVVGVLTEGLRRLRARSSEVVGLLSETLAKAQVAKS